MSSLSSSPPPPPFMSDALGSSSTASSHPQQPPPLLAALPGEPFLAAKLGGSVSIDFRLAVFLFLEFLRSASATAALLHPERRPIAAQPRGTRAAWVLAGPRADGWAWRRQR